MVQQYAGEFGDAALTAPDATPAVVTWARDSILFSSCNEDSNSELRAFGDLEAKRILCVTAGGGRVLNLLPSRPDVIWAVDLNPVQNYLLELKAAGMRALEHEAYLRFLGVRACSERLATYRRIREQLSADARSFFEAHPGLIEAGVLFEGRLERYFRNVTKLLQWTHALGIHRVFACEDLEQQRQWLRKLDNSVFRALAYTACRRGVLSVFSGDPGFYRYVPTEIPLHRAIYGGVIEHFTHHLARENPLMQLVFFGRFIYESALPVYLNAATYDRARAALEHVKLVVVTSTVHEALTRAGPAAFDAFSLSDISSYLDDESHDQLFAETLAAARPGAIVCSRSNIHHRPLRPEHEARLRRDRALERELSIADHSCVHKFVIGSVS
jgi:S-adenosylmethionine-diacylglycerol 3-amino-3-carboxypropyl transferase